MIDWYVRWRITDPLAYIRNVGLDEAAEALAGKVSTGAGTKIHIDPCR